MADFNIRSDSVDVEQIMQQIRARIREKRGSDYTEAELQQLATVKLEKFLDPRGVRSDLVEQFKKQHKPAEWPNYTFEENTLYESHRGFIRTMRRVLRPILKLFFNPDTITSALNVQSRLNTELLRQQERESLRYELVHNLVVEMTRLSIEVQNLKMRVESVSSRLDFDERRAQSLEKVVEYRPAARSAPRAAVTPPSEATPTASAPVVSQGVGATDPESGERKRRRRRRRRKPGTTAGMTGTEAGGSAVAVGAGGEPEATATAARPPAPESGQPPAEPTGLEPSAAGERPAAPEPSSASVTSPAPDTSADEPAATPHDPDAAAPKSSTGSGDGAPDQ